MHVVQKPFQAGRAHLESGDIVDASSWRLKDQLERQRYIRPATEDEVASKPQSAATAQRTATRSRK